MTGEFILRLFTVGILGAIIGLDREYRAKEAGFRTHFLVSLGSALIMIVSQYGFMQIAKEHHIDFDPSRVAAQVVSGIGFIGAGTIITETVCKGIDNCGRTMGNLRYRSGYWQRHVLARYIGNHIYIVGA